MLNHEPENADANARFGVTRDGTPAMPKRHLVEADVRIITGFIEPHFFAWFSGGLKGIMPGLACLDRVMTIFKADWNYLRRTNSRRGVWSKGKDWAHGLSDWLWQRRRARGGKSQTARRLLSWWWEARNPDGIVL